MNLLSVFSLYVFDGLQQQSRRFLVHLGTWVIYEVCEHSGCVNTAGI